jgi:hypothetical protein
VKFPAHEKNADIRVSKVFYMKNWSGKKKREAFAWLSQEPGGVFFSIFGARLPF